MIRVLVLTTDTDGIGYYRNFMPHLTINDPDFEIDIRMLQDGTLNLLDQNFISKYNIIFYNKAIPFAKPEFFKIFYDLTKKYNIKIVYDIDDYWILSPTHSNYDMWKKSKADEAIVKAIKDADHVTTTTSLFAHRISEENPNVSVLENGVNLEEQQWTYDRKPSDKIRFLWGGGISHLIDLRLLKTSFEIFDKDFLKKSQIFMCGYDLRVRTPKGMIQKSDPKTNTWSAFENIFSNNWRYVTSNEHRAYLKSYDDTGYGIKEEFIDEFYQRRWTRPILNYGHMYNEADVCLAPLKNNNMFNFYKSNLKVIEAGAHHCPILASNYGPYTVDDIEGIEDGKRKGFLIDENKPKMWYEKMKFYADNPDEMREHGENLYEYVKEKLCIKVIGEKRKQLYKILTDGRNI
jgi:glycosyltransferase involved in cell wall biosynthesis